MPDQKTKIEWKDVRKEQPTEGLGVDKFVLMCSKVTYHKEGYDLEVAYWEPVELAIKEEHRGEFPYGVWTFSSGHYVAVDETNCMWRPLPTPPKGFIDDTGKET